MDPVLITATVWLFWQFPLSNSSITVPNLPSEAACHELNKKLTVGRWLPGPYKCIPYQVVVGVK